MDATDIETPNRQKAAFLILRLFIYAKKITAVLGLPFINGAGTYLKRFHFRYNCQEKISYHNEGIKTLY